MLGYTMMSNAIRIVIADDHIVFRAGVADLLGSEPDIQVVGQGGSADEAVHLVGKHQPNLVLLDVDMPGGGLNALASIAREWPDARVVLLTVSAAEEDLVTAIQLGARGYILKGVSARQLVGILRAVATGGIYFPKPFLSLLIS
jgi:two-component system nitrate/nitrite response regulator NarL